MNYYLNKRNQLIKIQRGSQRTAPFEVIMKNPFKELTKFELWLWIVSAVGVCASFAFSPDKDPMTLCASLIGVTALIFIAKGYVVGQAMCIGFSVLYGIISFR